MGKSWGIRKLEVVGREGEKGWREGQMGVRERF